MRLSGRLIVVCVVLAVAAMLLSPKACGTVPQQSAMLPQAARELVIVRRVSNQTPRRARLSVVHEEANYSTI